MRIAALQYCASGDSKSTLDHIIPMIRAAARDRAKLVCLPEAADFLAKSRAALNEQADWEDQCGALDQLCASAAGLKIWLLAGSLFVRRRSDEKLVNRSYLIDPAGQINAHYDKIHMFDADVGDGKSYRESASFAAGDKAVMTNIDDGSANISVGMTICYDVRFPHLYRGLAKQGASIITVPAAFTYDSGRAHWHVLLRARAIETGCFIVAPAQCGTHADGRRTYGHAMIISPWGEVLAAAATDDAQPKAGANDAVIIADLELDLVAKARQAIPSLQNDRSYSER